MLDLLYITAKLQQKQEGIGSVTWLEFTSFAEADLSLRFS